MYTEPHTRSSEPTALAKELQISFLDLAFGFLPAFRDIATGRTHLATNRDGSIASMHILDGVPYEWVDEIDASGQIVSLKDGIMAGFVRGDGFFTLDDLRHSVTDA